MEEKLIMSNTLSLIKGLCGTLTHATIESPNNSKEFNKALDDCLELQNKVYKFMESKGWYQTEAVTQDKIEKVKQKYPNPQ
jgi:spore coat protein CotF